jgi:hypothetical protein
MVRDVLAQPVILSANGHAAKLGLQADYVVCKDHVHTETKELMEPAVRALGAPVVTRQYWGDYRLSGWPMQGNSGMLALGVATLLGCRPIIPIGFDCYQGATYFHDPTARNVSGGMGPSMWRTRYQRFNRRLEEAPIRSLEGCALSLYRPFDTHEVIVPHMPIVLRAFAEQETHWIRLPEPRPMKDDTRTTVPENYAFPVDPNELRWYQQGGSVEFVDSQAMRVVKSSLQSNCAEGN